MIGDLKEAGRGLKEAGRGLERNRSGAEGSRSGTIMPVGEINDREEEDEEQKWFGFLGQREI